MKIGHVSRVETCLLQNWPHGGLWKTGSRPRASDVLTMLIDGTALDSNQNLTASHPRTASHGMHFGLKHWTLQQVTAFIEIRLRPGRASN